MPEESAVLDANVLIHSRGQFPYSKIVVPLSVKTEVKSELSRMKMEKLDIETRNPSKEFLEKVRQKSREINSPTSEQDEGALALAIQENILLVTDDKALQNLALHLEVEFDSFNTDKVSEKREWKKVCENCGKEVSGAKCPRCGSTRMKRKRDLHS
jgi:UPF0271 protein